MSTNLFFRPSRRPASRARSPRFPHWTAAAGLGLLLSLPGACKGSTPAGEPSERGAAALEAAAAPAAWTPAFREPAVLLATEVEIEGPPGLIAHVALTVDPEIHEYSVRTVPEGLLQEVSLKSPAAGGLVRCQLDHLQIAAERRVRVLERPQAVPVTVSARGNAFWTNTTGQERRGAELRLEGQSAP